MLQLRRGMLSTSCTCMLPGGVRGGVRDGAGVSVVSSQEPTAVPGSTQRSCVSSAEQAFTLPVDVLGVLKTVSVSCPACGVGMCTRPEAECPHPRSIGATVGLGTHN